MLLDVLLVSVAVPIMSAGRLTIASASKSARIRCQVMKAAKNPAIATAISTIIAGCGSMGFFVSASIGGLLNMTSNNAISGATVYALPEIIERLRSRGYRFVTVPELLHCPATLAGWHPAPGAPAS